MTSPTPTGCSSAAVRATPPKLENAAALEHHEELLLVGVAVSRRALPRRRQDDVVQAGGHGAGGLPGAAGATIEDGGHVGKRDDVRWALGSRQQALGRTGGCLTGEGRIALAEHDPTREGPGYAGTGKRRERGISALTEDEHIKPRGTGAQGVRAALGSVHDAIAGRDGIGLSVLPQKPFAGEDEEDLLIGAMLVSGRGEVLRGHLDAAETHGTRADLASEITPDPLDVADGELARGTLIQIGNPHSRARLSAGGRAPAEISRGSWPWRRRTPGR